MKNLTHCFSAINKPKQKTKGKCCYLTYLSVDVKCEVM